MKNTVNLAFIAAMACSSVSGTAAAKLLTPEIYSDVRAVIAPGTNLTFAESGSVITIGGYYNDEESREQVVNILKKADGVDQVIDNSFNIDG